MAVLQGNKIELAKKQIFNMLGKFLELNPKHHGGGVYGTPPYEKMVALKKIAFVGVIFFH